MEEKFSRQVKYWLEEADHDFFFIVGPENGPTEKIGVVKHILLAYSEPLKTLLKNSKVGDLRLSGVEAKTFKTFLKCIYGAADSEIPNLSFEESAKVLYVIEKYSVSEIKPKIVSRLTELMSPDEIFVALLHPACFQAGDLSKEIKKIFENDMDKILSDERFLSLSDVTLMWIVQQELLNVQDMKIWSAVLKWSQNQIKTLKEKNMRPQIFDLLKNIHSSTVGITEFCKNVTEIDAGALLKERVIESYQSFCRPPTITRECKHLSSQHIATCSKMSSGCMTSSADSIIMSSIKIKEIGEQYEYSENFQFHDYSWRIVVSKGKEGVYHDYLRCYLICGSRNPTWSCTVSCEIILLNQYSGANVSKSFKDHTFTQKEPSCGFSNFYSWQALTQNYNGFVKDDCIILMVRFRYKKP